MQVHGHDRVGELADAMKSGTAVVVEPYERITGYATVPAFFGHAVAETNLDLQALIASARMTDWPPSALNSPTLTVPSSSIFFAPKSQGRIFADFKYLDSLGARTRYVKPYL